MSHSSGNNSFIILYYKEIFQKGLDVLAQNVPIIKLKYLSDIFEMTMFRHLQMKDLKTFYGLICNFQSRSFIVNICVSYRVM